MKDLLNAIFVLTVIMIAGCKSDDPNGPGNPETHNLSPYKAPPPAGKLPYPIHDPAYTEQEYQTMVNQLFIINNFGQDQFSYIHDGLDFMAPNGTKVFAIDSGYVRANIGGDEYYRTLIIEDKNKPGYAWSYTHIYNFAVKEGDYVKQGTYLASINFKGLEHTHIVRLKLKDGGSWTNFYDTYALQPDSYFYFIDTKPPLIKKPFYYFDNYLNEMFNNAGLIKVKGEVDIVVGIRETGEYAKGLYPGSTTLFGDRLAVSRILYSIISPSGEVYNFNSFNFSKIYFSNMNAQQGDRLIYKDYTIIEGKERTGMGWSDYYSYYIITNYNETNDIAPLNLSGALFSWNTEEKKNDGTPKFPNGKYKITVTAFDFKGNSSVESDSVQVDN